MAKQYQWKASMGYEGDTDLLTHGVTPNIHQDWQTADIGTSASGTYTYWYHDSNTSYAGHYQDTISSRVAIPITQTWTTSVDTRNYVTVTVTTTINEIARDSYTGNDQATPGREITVYNGNGGTVFHAVDGNIASNHQISGAINIGTESYTLAPGDATVVKSSVVVYNTTVGMASFDRISVGIQFRNILPAEWTATINYDETGGSQINNTVVTDANDPKTVTVTSQVPTRKHFDFLGWSTTNGGPATLHGGDTVSISSGNPTITLYAVWEYTYRPGKILVNGVWKSHDRDTNLQGGKYMTMLGRCHILRNGTWVEMRTRANRTGVAHSPVIRRNGQWVSMALIGDDGSAHDVGY